MMNRNSTAFSLLGSFSEGAVSKTLRAAVLLGVAAAVLAPSVAEAQCRPDDLFCAELRIGPAQPPPPPVIVQPPPVYVQPPTVYVQPPTVYVQPPPPPVVIVRPPPPPQVVVMQPPPRREPQVVAVQLENRRTTRYELVPDFDLGLHFNFAGLAMENAGMGGVQAAFRIRPIQHIAIDIGLGALGGESYNYGIDGGGARFEMPVLLDVLFYFNPQHRFQVYALVGVGASYAEQELNRGTRAFSYVGGEAGLGFELRLSRFFALNLDMRGFIRQNVTDGPAEFTNFEGQQTNLSGGGYGTLGMTLYFGG